MDGFDEEGPRSAKRDRTARLLRVVTLLRAHPEGLRPAAIAKRLAMSPRTVYRDLHALDGELEMPVWNEGGAWGMLDGTFLPPLKLTLQEAMAVFLAARLMVRYVDKYDPDLASAFEKLAQNLPESLAGHVQRSMDAIQRAPVDPVFHDHVEALTKAWSDRRVVEIDYEAAAYEGRRGERSTRVVRPYLVEPSIQTHALYLIGWDEDRAGTRTFKIERIQGVTLLPRTFEPPEEGQVEATLQQGWDIIADQAPVEVVLRFSPQVADRVLETRWHPGQRTERQADGSLRWSTTVAGTIEIRLWIQSWGADVEVLGPRELREQVAAELRRALQAYGG